MTFYEVALRRILTVLFIPLAFALPLVLTSCEADSPLFLDAVFHPSPAFAQASSRPVRVLLARGKGATITVPGAGSVYSQAGVAIAENVTGNLQFTLADGKAAYKGARSGEFTVVATSGYLGVSGGIYRGKMRILASGGELLVLNVIDIEEYLRGVVPGEMPSKWHIEALKAQAVAARTYALRMMIGRENSDWDVVATTADQVYGGVKYEKETTDEAIRRTAGEVIVYGDSPIIAYYHSDAGGYTKAGDHPYLKPVKSEEPDSPYQNWQLSYSPEEFSKLLEDGGLPGGRVLGIAAAYDDYGRVQGLSVTTDKTTYGVTALQFRRIIGVMIVRSTRFTIMFEGGVVWDKEVPVSYSDKLTAAGKGGEASVKIRDSYVASLDKVKQMKGDYVALGQRRAASKIVITGSGFGHGSGMSQWGALHMAKTGKTYLDILTHYYTDVKIVQMWGAVNSEDAEPEQTDESG